MTPEEKERRRQRRAERAERTKALAPRVFDRKRETTDVSKTAAAKQRRDRRAARRFNESANGGWKRKP